MTDPTEDPAPPQETDGSGTAPDETAAPGPDMSVAAETTTEPGDAQDPGDVVAPGVQAAAPQFAELQPEPGAGGQASLAMLYDLMMPVSVELGRTAMAVRDVLGLGRGSIIPLNRLAGEPIDIYVSDRKLAEGEVVVLGDHFGVRLTRVLPTTAALSAPELQMQGA